LGGNSSNSGKIFTLLRKVVRVMTGAQPTASCRSIFKQLESLSVPCHYILSLMDCIVNNLETLQINSSIHDIHKRNKYHFHRPNANLFCCQNSAFYDGIKTLNSLPPIVGYAVVRLVGTLCYKVAGSIPNGVTGNFHRHNSSGRTVVLGLTQPLTEMSTRNIAWV
jgi:hypothetical protein